MGVIIFQFFCPAASLDCYDNTTYFQCSSGPCVAQSLVCNGVDDCTDGSDELDICRKAAA